MMKNGLPPPNYGAIEKNSSEEENEEIKAKAMWDIEDANYKSEYKPLIPPEESGNHLGICLYVLCYHSKHIFLFIILIFIN